MAVFRIERTKNYTVMSNYHLRDKALSLKSKGLLSMMLSLPEDWNYTTRGMAKICKEGVDPVSVGSYRGFAMSVSFDAFRQEYMLLLKGEMTHRATLGTDPRGNLTRIDNALAQMPQRLEAVKNQLDNLYQQQAAAKAEVGKPFAQEQELRDKSARLAELDVLLNIDGHKRPAPEAVVAKSSRPSVLEGLKRPVPLRSPEKKPKHHEQEVR